MAAIPLSMDNETLTKLWRTETDPDKLKVLAGLIEKSLNKMHGHQIGLIMAKAKRQAEEPTLLLERKAG